MLIRIWIVEWDNIYFKDTLYYNLNIAGSPWIEKLYIFGTDTI